MADTSRGAKTHELRASASRVVAADAAPYRTPIRMRHRWPSPARRERGYELDVARGRPRCCRAEQLPGGDAGEQHRTERHYSDAPHRADLRGDGPRQEEPREPDDDQGEHGGEVSHPRTRHLAKTAGANGRPGSRSTWRCTWPPSRRRPEPRTMHRMCLRAWPREPQRAPRPRPPLLPFALVSRRSYRQLARRPALKAGGPPTHCSPASACGGKVD